MKATELAKKEAAENSSKKEQKTKESNASESTTFWDEFLISKEE